MLAAVLLPLALLPLGQLSPLLATETARLSRQAGATAAHLASVLPSQAAARRLAEASALATLLAEAAPPDAWIALLDAEGRVLGHSPAAPAGASAILAVEQAVPGWPLRIRAMRVATAPHAGLLPLLAGALTLTLLGGALLLHRRERRHAAAAAESEAQLRLLLGASGLGCWSWAEEEDRLRCDARAQAILGCPASGDGLAALESRIDPADRPRLAAAIEEARSRGAPAQCTLRLASRPGAAARWIELRAQAVPHPWGTTWHGVLADITARRRTEEDQHLLLREVDHRAKNTLAVVQALLRLSRNEEPATLVPRVEARIAAMARAHTLLARSRWQGAPLRPLLEGELARPAADGPPPPGLEGPEVTLAAIAAQPFAMVLHELASHSRRHGALSHPGGRLALAWSLTAEGGLRLAWEEQEDEAREDGAARPEPMRGGLGQRIVEATVRDQLGGRIERDWDRGLRCVIHLPPSSLHAAPPEG